MPMPRHPRQEAMIRFSREQRQEMTPAEGVLWEVVRDRRLDGFKFYRQYTIERFSLDFYCHSRRLAVEVDGAVHDEPDQHARDLQRDARLEGYGIRVLRLPNALVLTDLPGTRLVLLDALALPLIPRTLPSRR